MKRPLWPDLVAFVGALASEWVILVTGGALAVVLGTVEHFRGANVDWRTYAWAVLAVGLVASFRAWRNEYILSMDAPPIVASWKTQPFTTVGTLTITNAGPQVVLNVFVDALLGDDVRLDMERQMISWIGPYAPSELAATPIRHKDGSSDAEIEDLATFIRETKRGLRLRVTFSNEHGRRFARHFLLSAGPDEQVECFPMTTEIHRGLSPF